MSKRHGPWWWIVVPVWLDRMLGLTWRWSDPMKDTTAPKGAPPQPRETKK